MGAAMAPAAYATIKAHFDDMKTAPEDFDLIVTGDLGQAGQGNASGACPSRTASPWAGS